MKVLIVDDEDVVRLALKRLFSRSGHEVAESADGLDALDVWQKFSPDLVLLDVLIPGMTGPQVLQERSLRRGPEKVVLMSAFGGDYDLQKATDLGADDFFEKPFENIFDLLDRAEKLVGLSTES